MSTVLVTGATGHLGSILVPRLLAAEHHVHTFSRTVNAAASPGVTSFVGDLTDGVGLPDALAGVDAVVHCASDPTNSESDATGIKSLIEAVSGSGHDPHLVYISIVGVDALPWSYYLAKHRVEQIIEASDVPWTIQRATQFHSFIATMIGQLAKSPLVPVPRGFGFQPVSTAEVAELLVSHVNNGPKGRADDFGGPEVLPAAELARTWLRAKGKHRPVVALPVPGRLGRAFRSGANVCPDATRAQGTWKEYLAEMGAGQGGARAHATVGGTSSEANPAHRNGGPST